MNTIETDVLVVGAGPGGSMAAKFAAMNGVRTLLIEKRQEIGSPVRCAEGVSTEWLDECEVKSNPRWVATKPDGARIYSPNGHFATVGADRAGNEVGLVLERDLFDKALAEDAAKAGADILLKTAAKNVLRSNGTITGITGTSLGQPIEIRAKIIIGADGIESQIGRWAGIRKIIKAKDMESTFQYRLANVECDSRFCDFYVGSCAPGGYIWVFPKSDETANVGIGVQTSRLEWGQPNTKEILDRWIADQPRYNKGKPLDFVAGGVSTNPPMEQTVADGVMLVGDAAGMIDPLTGGGIVNACLAGKYAGEIAAKAIQKGDVSTKFLQKYEKRWRKKFEKKLRRNWLAKEKVGKLDDATFDSIIQTLSEIKSDANTLSLLMTIGKKHPDLVKEFAPLMFA